MATAKKERPKRSSSQNVDYSLKYRKIIIPEDADNNKKNKRIKIGNNKSNSNKQYDNNPCIKDSDKISTRTPLFKTGPNGEIIGINENFEEFDFKQKNITDSVSENDSLHNLNEKNQLSNSFSSSSSSNMSNFPHSLSSDPDHGFEHTNTNGIISPVRDVINGATGLPLSQFPTEKIKRERLWNYKKIVFSSSNKTDANNINSSSSGNLQKKSDSALLFSSPFTMIEPTKEESNRKKTISNQNELGLEESNNTKRDSSMSRSRSLSPLLSSNSVSISHMQNNMDTINEKEQQYKAKLKTNESNYLTHQSCLRHVIDNDKTNFLEAVNIKTKLPNSHHIVSKPLIFKNKLFTAIASESLTAGTLKNQIVKANIAKDKDHNNTTTIEIENDDFCFSCGQTGSFLCCDTCSKSFHFLCLDPPMDPNNLPEGDWSCPNCVFKFNYPTQTKYKQGELQFVKNKSAEGKGKLFSKLLFKLQSYNPKQFSLTQSIKNTFEDVKTGPHNEYNDKTFKTPLTERQLFNTSYGQSITKLDSYCPEIHYATNDENPNKFLTCYKCNTTRFGSWDHPEESRLLIKCDYCQTPWHLDCIPNIPRASLKNLGYKWKCPLHANTVKQRRLSKKQPFMRPLQTYGFKNNGDIEIILDEIVTNKERDTKRIGELEPIPVVDESSIKVDFIDKIFNYKKLQKDNAIKLQERLIDKLVNNHKNQNVHDVASLVYFNYCNKNKKNEKLWNLRELCHLANSELTNENRKLELEDKEQTEGNKNIILTTQDVKELLMIKQLIQSKPKEEVIAFFGLK
ncbi:Rco1p PWA37_000746 [Arxiozyma heterogenica]|uniref:Rco1p n=1 Tax=Arxiozyma heterogenica TaxID=278026 RepID=UPI002EDC34FF